MGIIRAAHLIYDYITRDDETGTETSNRAIDDVDLDVNAGDFIAVLGHNGSGKSTLAKHINALLTPTGGSIWVKDMDTSDESLDVGYPSDCGHGVSKSGQSDHRQHCGGGCGLWPGKHRYPDG